MDADELLQSLGLSLGLRDLRFDSSGCARIAVRSAPAVNFERDDANNIHLYSVLCPVPPDQREAVFEQLLQGNLFGTATAGAALAIDREWGQISICHRVSADHTSADAFAKQVEAFVNAAEDWQTRLSHSPEDFTVSSALPLAMPDRMDEMMRMRG